MISTPAIVCQKTITKGNRRRTIRRVPESCRDTAPDFLADPAGIRRSRLQVAAKAPSCGAPGDQFHGSIVNLLQPVLDLPFPRFCRTFVDGRVQALNQGIDQRGTRFQWQGEGVAKQLRRRVLHESILSRAALVAGQSSSASVDCGLAGVAPHDLRRTCARHRGRRRDIGCKRRLRNAVNDASGNRARTAIPGYAWRWENAEDALCSEPASLPPMSIRSIRPSAVV